MRAILFSIVFYLSLQGCRTDNDFLTKEEQVKLLHIAIKLKRTHLGNDY